MTLHVLEFRNRDWSPLFWVVSTLAAASASVKSMSLDLLDWFVRSFVCIYMGVLRVYYRYAYSDGGPGACDEGNSDGYDTKDWQIWVR